MTQDAAGYARQIIRKPAGDTQMMEKCKRNPLEAIAGLLGVKLEEETLNAIASAVSLEPALQEQGGLNALLGRLFGK